MPLWKQLLYGLELLVVVSLVVAFLILAVLTLTHPPAP